VDTPPGRALREALSGWPELLAAAAWNSDERRLRAPLRLLAAVLVLVVVGTVAARVAGALAAPGRLLAPLLLVAELETALRALSAVAGAVAVAVTAWVVAAGVDRRWLADYGLAGGHEWWREAAFGTALGTVLMTLVFLAEVALGWVVVTGLFSADGGPVLVLAVVYLVTFVGVSVSEELLVRGMLLTNLAEGLAGLGPLSGRAGTAVAVVLSSLLFGALHAGNPNATPVSTTVISLAGVWLALGYVLTGELAIPLGAHLGWNYTQGVVYGYPVSGIRLPVSFVATEQSGPAVVTGGAFGPEAGLVGVTALLAGMAGTAWWVLQRGGRLDVDPDVWTPDLRWRGRRR